MAISAAPAIRNRTPFSVTVAIVATREKASAAKPSTTSSTPNAVIAAHFALQALDRLPKAMRRCRGVRHGCVVPFLRLLARQRDRFSSPSTCAAYSTIGTMRP